MLWVFRFVYLIIRKVPRSMTRRKGGSRTFRLKLSTNKLSILRVIIFISKAKTRNKAITNIKSMTFEVEMSDAIEKRVDINMASSM